jgi:hypothetical protein
VYELNSVFNPSIVRRRIRGEEGIVSIRSTIWFSWSI